MKRTYLFIFFILFYHTSFPQNNYKVILQNQFNGGVCFAGVSVGNYGGNYPSYNIPISIETNSVIKETYIITSTTNYDSTMDLTINVNNNAIELNRNKISNSFEFYYNSQEWQTKDLFITKIDNNIINNYTNFTLNLPQQFLHTPMINDIYLLVLYENPNLPLINTCLIFNEEDIWVPMEYTLNQQNKMDTTKDISLSLLTTDICGDWDAYKIMVNQDSIGG